MGKPKIVYEAEKTMTEASGIHWEGLGMYTLPQDKGRYLIFPSYISPMYVILMCLDLFVLL